MLLFGATDSLCQNAFDKHTCDVGAKLSGSAMIIDGMNQLPSSLASFLEEFIAGSFPFEKLTQLRGQKLLDYVSDWRRRKRRDPS